MCVPWLLVLAVQVQVDTKNNNQSWPEIPSNKKRKGSMDKNIYTSMQAYIYNIHIYIHPPNTLYNNPSPPLPPPHTQYTPPNTHIHTIVYCRKTDTVVSSCGQRVGINTVISSTEISQIVKVSTKPCCKLLNYLENIMPSCQQRTVFKWLSLLAIRLRKIRVLVWRKKKHVKNKIKTIITTRLNKALTDMWMALWRIRRKG